MPVQTASPVRTVLRELIDERGIRYSFLADKLGMTPSHFTRLMNKERSITMTAVDLLAVLLNIAPSAFFDGHELLERINAADAAQRINAPPASDGPGLNATESVS